MPPKKCTIIPPLLKPTDQVYYSGNYLAGLDINTGDILTGIIVKINNAISVIPSTTYDKIKAGNVTRTADGSAKSFTFLHNLDTIPLLPDGVSVVATSTGNIQDYKVNFDDQYIMVIYSVAPSNGDVISWSYIAVKNKT